MEIEHPSVSLAWDSYAQLASPVEGIWLIDKLYPTGGLVVVAGAPKVGKTLAVLEQMACIADPTTTTWNGFDVLTHGPVLYVQMDMSRWSFKDNHMRLIADAGYVPSKFQLVDRLFDIPAPFDLKGNKLAGEWIRRECERIQTDIYGQWPLVVVFDSLRDMYIGEEDKSSEMMEAITNMRRACGPACVVIIHHPTKFSGSQLTLDGDWDPIYTTRGSGHLTATADNVMFFIADGFVFKGRMIDRTVVRCAKDPDTHLWSIGAAADATEQATLLNLLGQPGNDALNCGSLADLAVMDLYPPTLSEHERTRHRKRLKLKLWRLKKLHDGDQISLAG